jgi:hypothetical protein
MIIYNKYLNFFIGRGVSDDLFIKLVDNDLNALTKWLSFKNNYAEKDLKNVIKLVKNGLKNGKLYKYLDK